MLGEALRTGVEQRRRAVLRGHRERHGQQHEQRHGQRPDEHELDLARLDLLAEVLGRAADHQAGDEHGQQDEQQHPVQARADAAEDDLAEQHVGHRDGAAEAGQGVHGGVDRAARGDGRDRRPQRRVGDAEARLLALEVAAGDAGRVLGDRAVGLGGVDDRDADREQREHRRVERPALAAAAHHAPERGRQPRRDDHDQQHLDEVREPAGVLERHRRVDVEEAAAVRAELLDDLLRGDGTEREGRLAAGHGRHVDVGRERLDDALGDEHERADDADRQQDVEHGPDQVLPEVAQRGRAPPREAADDGGQHGHADRGRGEVLDGQAGHLREVGEGRLARVELPVRVRDERRRGVEGDVPGPRAEALGVERVDPLRAQDQVQREERDEAEDDHRPSVGLPVLLARGVRAQRAVQEPLQRAQDAGEHDRLARVDARHVAAHERRQRREDGEEDGDLQPALSGHPTRSSRSMAASSAAKTATPMAMARRSMDPASARSREGRVRIARRAVKIS